MSISYDYCSLASSNEALLNHLAKMKREQDRSSEQETRIRELFRNIDFLKKEKKSLETIRKYTPKDQAVAIAQTLFTVALVVGAILLMRHCALSGTVANLTPKLAWLGILPLIFGSIALSFAYIYQWGGSEDFDNDLIWPAGVVAPIYTPFIPLCYAFRRSSQYEDSISNLENKIRATLNEDASFFKGCLESLTQTVASLEASNIPQILQADAAKHKAHLEKIMPDLQALVKACPAPSGC